VVSGSFGNHLVKIEIKIFNSFNFLFRLIIIIMNQLIIDINKELLNYKKNNIFEISFNFHNYLEKKKIILDKDDKKNLLFINTYNFEIKLENNNEFIFINILLKEESENEIFKFDYKLLNNEDNINNLQKMIKFFVNNVFNEEIEIKKLINILSSQEKSLINQIEDISEDDKKNIEVTIYEKTYYSKDKNEQLTKISFWIKKENCSLELRLNLKYNEIEYNSDYIKIEINKNDINLKLKKLIYNFYKKELIEKIKEKKYDIKKKLDIILENYKNINYKNKRKRKCIDLDYNKVISIDNYKIETRQF